MIDRKTFAEEIKCMEVGDTLKLTDAKPAAYRSMLSTVSLVLDRQFRTYVLDNGAWVIMRTK